LPQTGQFIDYLLRLIINLTPSVPLSFQGEGEEWFLKGLCPFKLPFPDSSYPLLPQRLGAKPERQYRDYNKYNYQDDGELEQYPFHAPPGPIDGAWLTKDTPQPPASNLKQNHQYQGCSQYNLSYVEISLHLSSLKLLLK
jgi:hypothetical protein